jgi:type III pantothenate kinase
VSWLVIDAGNTAVKWAVGDRNLRRFLGVGIAAHGATDALDQRLAAAWRGQRVSSVYATSVANEAVMHAIDQAAGDCFGVAVTWFGSQRHFEGHGVSGGVALINGYREPEQLGADRWHALIAGCALHPGESLVIASAGTATTVDCVRATPDAAAVFVGGVIAPGVRLMRQSLAQGTARLPLAEAGAALSVHATETAGAIASGVHFAQVGLVENVARAFATELVQAGKPAPHLLLTGGGAQALVAPLTRALRARGVVAAVVLENNLVLRGIALRARAEHVRAIEQRAVLAMRERGMPEPVQAAAPDKAPSLAMKPESGAAPTGSPVGAEPLPEGVTAAAAAAAPTP